MKEKILYSLEQLIENRERVKSTFPWDGGLIQLSCASIYTMKGQSVNETVLLQSKDLLKHKVSAFSNFRSTARSPIASMIALSDYPEMMLDNGLLIYDKLKQHFWSSIYLPLTAMVIAELAKPEEYERIVSRTRTLYKRMKEEHPFLTSQEDSAFCALMALSNKSDEQLMLDSEKCYEILNDHFFSSNAVQSLSHVLALCDGNAESKCQRTMNLFYQLKEAGYKYGTNYELPTLGILAMSNDHIDEIVNDVIEIDDWLSNQRGFGLFSSITRKHRLMYAAMIAQKEYNSQSGLEAVSVNSTLSLIIAQEAAMCAAIAASTAAAASASSSSN